MDSNCDGIKNFTSIKNEVKGEFILNKISNFKEILSFGAFKIMPFIIGGGFILWIGFLIDFISGNGQSAESFGTINQAAGWFSAIGKITLIMISPILGGYIAYSIVGVQGLMPGFVAGLLADGTGDFAYVNWDKLDIINNAWSGLWTRLFSDSLPMNSGFIGAIIGGFLAAIVVFSLTKGMNKFRKSFWGIRDILLIPVLSLLGIALIMFTLGILLGYVMFCIREGLRWLSDLNLFIFLSMLIGAITCIDIGGPFNKIAYTLGIWSVRGDLGINPLVTNTMAAAMGAGMVPSLAIALCTTMFKNTWTSKEQEYAKYNWFMGIFFISEGAIPFMVADPKRISLSAIAGGLITGLLIGIFKITLPSTSGGIFIFPLLNSSLFKNVSLAKGTGIAFYILAIFIGVLMMNTILGLWKKRDLKRGKIELIEIKTKQPILTI